MNIANPSWYYNDPNLSGKFTQETITCTATITSSSGAVATMSNPISLPILVYTPVWTANGKGGSMTVSIPPYAKLFPAANQNDYWLWAAPTTIGVDGMNIEATVAPPHTTPSTLFGPGTISLAQLISYDRSYTDSSGGTHTAQPNGVYGLDSGYPIAWDATQPTSLQYQASDSPGMDLSSVNAQSATEQNSFKDYIMYTPPGAGTNSVQAVPLAMFAWNENGQATMPSGGWAAWSQPNAGSVAPQALTNFTPSNEFPTWTQVLVGGIGGGFN